MVDTGIQPSFIPHDTAAPAVPRRSGGGGLSDLLVLCAIVLFVASAALAVAVFLYTQFLQTQSTSKVAQLQTAEAAFEPSLIEQLTRLDDRMHAAGTLLSSPIAPAAFFSALDQATLQTVSFQSLDLEVADAQHITVKMQGTAQSVNSIALQADIFNKGGTITNPIFSNITRQSDGVHFDLTADVNPSAINYGTIQTNGSQTVPATSSTQPVVAQPSAASGSPSAGSSASPFGSAASSSAGQKSNQ